MQEVSAYPSPDCLTIGYIYRSRAKSLSETECLHNRTHVGSLPSQKLFDAFRIID